MKARRSTGTRIRSCFLEVATLLLALSLPGEGRATPIAYSADLLEEDGRHFFASFLVGSANPGIDPIFVGVTQFSSVVDGITYSAAGTGGSDDVPIDAVPVLDGDGNLVALGLPFLGAVGFDSRFNLWLRDDGTWLANFCIPLPSCNPSYLSGTYSIQSIPIPEPTSGLLIAGGLTLLGMARFTRPGSLTPSPPLHR